MAKEKKPRYTIELTDVRLIIKDAKGQILFRKNKSRSEFIRLDISSLQLRENLKEKTIMDFTIFREINGWTKIL